MHKSEVAWTPRSTVVSPLRQTTAGTPLYPQPVFQAPRMWCVAAVTGVGIADHWDGKIGDCERQMLGRAVGQRHAAIACACVYPPPPWHGQKMR